MRLRLLACVYAFNPPSHMRRAFLRDGYAITLGPRLPVASGSPNFIDRYSHQSPNCFLDSSIDRSTRAAIITVRSDLLLGGRKDAVAQTIKPGPSVAYRRAVFAAHLMK